MFAYGLDIQDIMAWTYPQLLLLQKTRNVRVKQNRLFELYIASGTLSEDGFDDLFKAISGKEPNRSNRESQPKQPARSSQEITRDHNVDKAGNVLAAGAPLLSDIAKGKAMVPSALGSQIIQVKKGNN